MRAWDAEREANERFRAASALAELHIRWQWGAVERVAEALLECGSIPGEAVRTLIDIAPQKPRSLARIEDEIDLARRAEKADPVLRGLHRKLRERLAAAHLDQMRTFLRALESWEPKRVPLRLASGW